VFRRGVAHDPGRSRTAGCRPAAGVHLCQSARQARTRLSGTLSTRGSGKAEQMTDGDLPVLSLLVAMGAVRGLPEALERRRPGLSGGSSTGEATGAGGSPGGREAVRSATGAGRRSRPHRPLRRAPAVVQHTRQGAQRRQLPERFLLVQLTGVMSSQVSGSVAGSHCKSTSALLHSIRRVTGRPAHGPCHRRVTRSDHDLRAEGAGRGLGGRGSRWLDQRRGHELPGGGMTRVFPSGDVVYDFRGTGSAAWRHC
jgi:hypothetical protein